MKQRFFLTLLCLASVLLTAAQEHRRLTNLPHLYLETFDGRPISSKTAYVLARLWKVDERDSVSFYDSVQVRGRGNSTWGMAKKPYKLKFQKKEKFLGKGYANTKKWTLMANHGDKTLIRNALTSLMGERAGLKFNPAAKFVDMTLNGNYVGTYQISDQVDVRPHRVDISEQNSPLAEGDDISGGYLLESDGSRDFHTSSYWDGEAQRMLVADGFNTRRGVPMRIHYPEGDELEEPQHNYIRDFVNKFESVLFSSQFRDSAEGYRPLVDSVSLANWYLCTEMSGNVDGFYSTYFYKDRADDRLFWGPLWDYDIAYNNDNRTDRGGTNNSNTSRQLMKDVSYGTLRTWIVRMWQDPWFLQMVNRRYHQLLDEGMEEYLQQQIDSLAQLLQRSQQLNYQRWGINSRTLRERVLYSTYDEYIQDLRSYIRVHLPFLAETLDAVAPQPEPPVDVDFHPRSNYFYRLANVRSSTVLDVDAATDLVCGNPVNGASQSQQWHFLPLSSGWLFVTNRMTGLALHDPSDRGATANTLIGKQLTVEQADSTDTRQQWQVVPQDDGCFNLINRASQHCVNLSGGSAAAATPVLSYTSDERNATSLNRLWLITLADSVSVEDGLHEVPGALEQDYALAYDTHSGRLHFGAPDLAALTFSVRVFNARGQAVRTFRASEGTETSNLPRGLYIVTWEVDGRRRSVKLRL